MPVRLMQLGCRPVLVGAGMVICGVVGGGLVASGVVTGGVVGAGVVGAGVVGTAMQKSALSCISHLPGPCLGRGLMVHKRLMAGLILGS